jgi:hypothetical protein
MQCMVYCFNDLSYQHHAELGSVELGFIVRPWPNILGQGSAQFGTECQKTPNRFGMEFEKFRGMV